MKSSLKNMVLCLGLITLAASAGLGYVYRITEEPIARAKAAKVTDALRQVIASFDNDPSADAQELTLDGMPVKVYTGRTGDAVSGYAVETMTKSGFGGEVRMMVGFTPEGEVHNIEVLQQNETPGLGSKMADEDNPLVLSFRGRNPADMKLSVKKDGGDVDAITASTISSRAYVDAVERAHRAYKEVATGEVEEPVDYIELVLGEAISRHPAVEVEIDGTPFVVTEQYDGVGPTGYAVQAESDGRNETIRLMVGFLPDGTIEGIKVMSHGETRNGAGISAAGNPLETAFTGRKADDVIFALKPVEDGVDGISGATVSSKAYVEAVRLAWVALQSVKYNEPKGNE